MQFLPYISSPSSWIWKIPRQRGGHFFRNILSTLSHMLPWKMQLLPHISSPCSQILKIQRQIGAFFFSRQTFWVPSALCYLENEVFAPYLLSKGSDLKNSRQKGDVFLKLISWVPKPYVILKNAVFPLYLLSMQSDLKKSKTKGGHFLRQTFWVPSSLCYL